MGGRLTTQQLEEKAEIIREDIITMLEVAGSGHSAGPLGLADIFAALYFDILNYDPQKPDWAERDLLLLSNGHCVPVQYAAMAEADELSMTVTPARSPRTSKVARLRDNEWAAGQRAQSSRGHGLCYRKNR